MKRNSLAILGASVLLGFCLSATAAENGSPQASSQPDNQPTATKSWAELELQAKQLGLSLDRFNRIEDPAGASTAPTETYTANNGWRSTTSAFGANLTNGNNAGPTRARRNYGVGTWGSGFDYYSHGGFYGLGAYGVGAPGFGF